MPRSPRRIALDLGEIHFLETYRAQACRGILRYAHTLGHWELLYNDHHFSLLGKYRSLGELASRGVDGLLVCSWTPRKLEAVRRLRLPVVSISNEYAHPGIPCVLSDDRCMGRLAAEHLLERGFRELGFCGSKGVPWDAERWSGFRDAAAARGIEPAFHEARPTARPTEGRTAARRLSAWLRRLPKPSGIFCADDTHAYRLLDAARHLKISVPRDLAIVGADDNMLICIATTPTLSSVRPDAEFAGFRAAQLLDEMLDGAPVPDGPILVAPRGVATRASSDALVVADPLVAAALGLIAERLAEPTGAAELSVLLKTSRRTVETRFRAAVGISVGDFVLRRRIERARTLLEVPHLPIAEVARRCGFPQAGHFCTRFRQETGLTPTAWRARAVQFGAGGEVQSTFG